MSHAYELPAALGAFAALLLATAAVALRPALLTRVGWVLAAAAWWVLNAALEGPVLLTVTPDNGLTVADLLPGVCLVAVALVRRRAARPR